MGRIFVGVLALAGLTIPAAHAAPPPHAGTAFEPPAMSPKLYDIAPPRANPARQTHMVKAADGVNLYVETWLPKAKDGHVPPARVPTVLVMTPYVNAGQVAYPDFIPVPLIEDLVRRGYAVAQNHVRGTGSSGGCMEQTGKHEPDDGARVVEYLGRDAPWSDGNVGMFGISYDAETQVATAAKGDPAKTKYLKAIIPAETVGGLYEYEFFDGVPYAFSGLTSFESYFEVSMAFAPPTTARDALQRPGCQPLYWTEAATRGGSFSKYWRQHELRLDADKIKAATLLLHGHADWNVKPIAMAGLFDHIPASTPHKGIFGYWEHAFPNDHNVEYDWERTDFMPMVLAWYDRYLRGVHNGVDDWPATQVQGSDGQWRVEPDWPTTGGPAAQLALGAGGKLGATTPAGATAYSEAGSFIDQNPQVVEYPVPFFYFGVLPNQTRAGAVFTTAPLKAPLEVTGQPVLDAWLTTNKRGGYITAKIEALDASGKPLPHAFDYGYRSLRHLDPIEDGAFMQERSASPPVNTPIHVLVRFHPNDFVVPAGGRLRISFAGSADSSQPSNYGSTITLLHDCAHPTTLRFLLPTPSAPLLNVREKDEKGALNSARGTIGLRDGGGAGSAKVCGAPPIRNAILGD